MKTEEYLGIAEGHSLKHVSSRMKGPLQETDIDEYEEYDLSGQLVARYTVTSHTSLKPPHETTRSFAKHPPVSEF